jgi:hypothetical protein
VFRLNCRKALTGISSSESSKNYNGSSSVPESAQVHADYRHFVLYFPVFFISSQQFLPEIKDIISLESGINAPGKKQFLRELLIGSRFMFEVLPLSRQHLAGQILLNTGRMFETSLLSDIFLTPWVIGYPFLEFFLTQILSCFSVFLGLESLIVAISRSGTSFMKSLSTFWQSSCNERKCTWTRRCISIAHWSPLS